MSASNFFTKSSAVAAQSAKDDSIRPSTVQPTADLKPWIEKYRPKTMNDISSQAETVAVLRKTIESKNLPHLLFYGPAGTGKTSTILALARELYGPELMKTRILELNASDERGIDIVREKIKNFAKATVSTEAINTTTGRTAPPYKIIILDEADSMTTDAQSALRRVMENYSKVTRFCLICNYISRIIEPIASRCAKFRFKPLEESAVTERLQHVCQAEKVTIAPEALSTLIKVSGGDLRKSIMTLQSAYRLYQIKMITEEGMCEISGVIPGLVIEKAFEAWKSKDLTRIQDTVDGLMSSGFSGIQILTQLHEMVLRDAHLSSLEKSKMALSLGHADRCLIDGSDESLQILNLFVSAF